jgi:uncharacterized delta-60 repeat protein
MLNSRTRRPVSAEGGQAIKHHTNEYRTPIGGVIPAAVIAAGLTGPVAWSAPGDLDPTFGNVGRAELPQDLSGAVWSLEAMHDDGYLLAGGDEYCGYYTSCDDLGFATSLSGSGVPDAAYLAAIPGDLRALHVAAQKDGRLVGMGLSGTASDAVVVFRLAPDGSLDPTFGTGGRVTIDRKTIDSEASIAVDPDGRVVIHGGQQNTSVLLRLMPDGSWDPSFGSNGVAQQPTGSTVYSASLVRTPDGAYRMLDGSRRDCHVRGVTAIGNVDNGFGTAGSVGLATIAGADFYCMGLGVLPDGRLLVAGQNDAGGDVVRLSANGALDATYTTNAESYLSAISAVAVSASGSVFVAGLDTDGLPGTVVSRLLPDGRVDTGFGAGGRAWVDLQGGIGSNAEARVLAAPSADQVLVGGVQRSYWYLNSYSYGYWYDKPYVARLTMSGAGPGVIGVKTMEVQARESERQATVVVRRTGGSSGAVSVDYHTDVVAGSATVGKDFEATQGQLEWASGETGDKTIVVPILGDQVEYEGKEQFVVTLEKPVGGGLGSSTGLVTILGDGYPHGAFAIRRGTPVVRESDAIATFFVYRIDGGSGAVSVTVQPVAGTAAQGTDFNVDPVTLAWADGQVSPQLVTVRITDDHVTESDETFSMTLTNPTGEAVIALDEATASVIIQDSPPPQRGNKSGGGMIGLTSLLLLGLLGPARRRARGARSVAQDRA